MRAASADPPGDAGTAPAGGTGPTPTERQRPASPRGWMLAAVCLAPFVTQLATFAFSPFLPFVAADLGTSVAVLGQIPALALLTAAMLGLVIGPLTVGFVWNGVAIVSQNTLLMDISPASRATTTSLNQTCMSLGGAIGSSLGGVLLAVSGFPALGLLALACNVVSALCLLPARR